jgi:hypothetical protein
VKRDEPFFNEENDVSKPTSRSNVPWVFADGGSKKQAMIRMRNLCFVAVTLVLVHHEASSFSTGQWSNGVGLLKKAPSEKEFLESLQPRWQQHVAAARPWIVLWPVDGDRTTIRRMCQRHYDCTQYR